jgi:hypothetical protein
MSVDVLVKKSVSGTSGSGLTFHWLRCVFGESFDDALISAVRLVYFPAALAATSKSWDRVASEVARSRMAFERRDSLIEVSQVLRKPIPKRVYFSFDQSFDAASYEGMTFEWLVSQYSGDVFEAIAHALRLVYLPSALAWLPDNLEIAVDASKRSEYVFEQMMRDAILKAGPSDLHFNTDPFHRLMAIIPSEIPEGRALVSGPDPPSPEALNDSEDDFDDDFVNPFNDDDD